MRYARHTTDPVPFIIVSVILAILLTIATCIFILPDKRRAQLSPFFRALADIFNFKHLLLESILRFLYILSTLFVVLFGFFMLFMETYGESMAPAGLMVMLLGPIVIRISYEFAMLMLILLKNVIDINRKTGVAPAAPAPAAPPAPKCPSCGSTIESDDAIFCTSCGYKLHE